MMSHFKLHRVVAAESVVLARHVVTHASIEASPVINPLAVHVMVNRRAASFHVIN